MSTLTAQRAVELRKQIALQFAPFGTHSLCDFRLSPAEMTDLLDAWTEAQNALSPSNGSAPPAVP